MEAGLLAECPNLSENTGSSEDTGSKTRGFELKVDRVINIITKP
jgi:hypothetical protein